MMRRLAVMATLLPTAVVGVLASAAPASAALPDKFAFVQWNGAATVPTGTTPAATTVVTGPPGRFRILFPGAGAAKGVVHVTAVNDVPHWCQANVWGQAGLDEVVYVDCYKAGGGPDFTPFTAIFESSSPPTIPINGRFGYVDSLPSGSLVSQYNSSGALNSVIHVGVGAWIVNMPALSTPGPVDGSLQATAVNSVPARCKVAKWSSAPSGQQILVNCYYGPTGAPFDTRFTLTFQYQQSLYGAGWPPKYFGYVWNVPPMGPVSTNFNSQLGIGVNSVSYAGTGLSLVKFPRLAIAPATVQVTATGPTSDFCNLLMSWVYSGTDILVRDVACYTNAGVRIDTGSLVSANSAF
jgi:hypothetical protein